MEKLTKKALARVDAALAKVAKNIPNGSASAAPGPTKDMTPEQFTAHARTEVEQAKKEAPSLAKRRIAKLREGVAIMKGTSWESEATAKIPIFVDKTTSSSEQSDKTIASAPIQQASTQYFAKALERIAKLEDEDDEDEDDDDEEEEEEEEEEETEKGAPEKPGTPAKKVAKSDDGWPDDLNETPPPGPWGKDGT